MIALLSDICLEVYEKTRELLYVLLMVLSVKLRTYIGEPLYCREDESAEEFADRVSMESFPLSNIPIHQYGKNNGCLNGSFSGEEGHRETQGHSPAETKEYYRSIYGEIPMELIELRHQQWSGLWTTHSRWGSGSKRSLEPRLVISRDAQCVP